MCVDICVCVGYFWQTAQSVESFKRHRHYRPPPNITMIRSICDKNWMKIEPKPGKTESHFLLILNSKCNNILLLISHHFILNYVMLLHTKSCNKLCHSCRHSTRRVLSQFLWHLIVCHNISNKKELGGFPWGIHMWRNLNHLTFTAACTAANPASAILSIRPSLACCLPPAHVLYLAHDDSV